ncbi:2-oxoacid:acceptor oxidoreductase subunit alpha [Patescibacteria group bacterium]
MKTNFNIKIGGHAGEGIKVSGLILARSLTRLGFSVFGYSEYPSLIRGGHNSYQIKASTEKVYSQTKHVDLLIALNQETITLHQDELASDSLILYDPDEFEPPKENLKGKLIAINLVKITENAGGKPIMANMASLGAILTLLGLPIDSLNEMIKKEFLRKGAEIVSLNQKIAQAGKDYIKDKFKKDILKTALPTKKEKRMILTGNEAVGLGAIAGGLKAYIAYPMTPSTSILHFLAAKASEADILVKHVEDEISAINMSIGASVAGVRVMTGTSGGGLCLMAEGVTLSGISETPLVVVNSMRPGPGLGMPTWTAQGDLQFVLSIGHDEFPRIVLTPGDAGEAFELTKYSLILAEKYQVPVIILIDKYLSESDYSLKPFAEIHKNERYSLVSKPEKEFKRYKLTDNGVSKRSVPGQLNGNHCCNSYEHDELGFGIEDSSTRNLMMEKRLSKLISMQKDMPIQPFFGNKEATTKIISWGSNKGPIQEALKSLPKAGFLHLNCLSPFPKKQVTEFIKGSKKVFCLECNATAQLASLIKKETGLEVEPLLKYDGRPFYPEEIIKEFKK